MRLHFGLLVLIVVAGCTATVRVAEPNVDRKPEPTPVPAVEQGEGRLSRLVMDDANACVSVDDRRVLCWGHEFMGEGVGHTASDARVARFVDLGQGDATLIDLDFVPNLSHDRVCALFDDGWLRCVYVPFGGEPTSEKLPDGVVEVDFPEGWNHCQLVDRKLECPIETRHQLPREPIGPIVDFDSAGCAVIEGGEIRCRADSHMQTYTLGHVAGAVGVGWDGENPCVWTETGALWCTEPIADLVPLQQSDGFYRLLDAGVHSAAIGYRHLCVLESAGEVWCAGDNSDAQLGVGDSDEHLGRTTVELPGPAHELAVSYSASCALVEQGVWCWGSHGAARGYEDEYRLEASRLSFESRALFLFGDRSCAVTPSEELYCWGEELDLRKSRRGIVRASQPELALAARTPIDGLTERTLLSKGELFQGKVIARDVERKEMVVERELRGVAVSVTDHHFRETRHCTISKKGKLECWEFTESGSWQRVATIDRRTGVTAADIDLLEVCAVSEGKVACAWFDPERHVNEAGWVTIGGINDALAVAHDQRAFFNTCALTQAQRVLCWPIERRAEVFPLEVDDAVEIIGGEFGLCVRNEAGAVRCGSVPTLELVLERGAIDLEAGPNHWCARLDEDGDGRSETIFCHGENRNGQLGTLPGHVLLRPTAIELPDATGQ